MRPSRLSASPCLLGPVLTSKYRDCLALVSVAEERFSPWQQGQPEMEVRLVYKGVRDGSWHLLHHHFPLSLV